MQPGSAPRRCERVAGPRVQIPPRPGPHLGCIPELQPERHFALRRCVSTPGPVIVASGLLHGPASALLP